MLAASANNPRLIDPVRHRLARLLDGLFAEGPNGVRQVALWPAVYGLLLWQHLGFITPGVPSFRAILDELLALAEGEGALPAESVADGLTTLQGVPAATRQAASAGARTGRSKK
jgi:hypothetical protein